MSKNNVAATKLVKDCSALKKIENMRDIATIKKSKKMRGKAVNWETLKAECKL